MGKVSLADKMRIQALLEQRLGVKAIMAAYLNKGWALSTVKKIASVLIERGRQQNAKLVVVGRNLRALKQTLLLSFLTLKNR